MERLLDPATLERTLCIDSELARDFAEFLAAKRRRREPLRLKGKGAAAADYLPRSAQGFANFRAAQRENADFGHASDQLDAFEHSLMRRHQVGLPLPRKVTQEEDRSLTLFFGEKHLTIRCFPDGVATLLGGMGGTPSKGVTREVLDALALLARMQVPVS